MFPFPFSTDSPLTFSMSSGVSGKPVNAARKGSGPCKKREALASVATTDDDQRPTTSAHPRAQHPIRRDSPMNSPTFALRQPANARRARPEIEELHRNEAAQGNIAHSHPQTNILSDASTRRINAPPQQGAEAYCDHNRTQLTQIPLCRRCYEPHVPSPSYLSFIGPELHASLLYHSKRMRPQPRQRGWYSSSKIDLMAPLQHSAQAGSQGLEQVQHISAGGGQYVYPSSALAQQPPPPPRVHVPPPPEKTSRRDRMSISFLIDAQDHDANLIRNTNSVHAAESEQRPDVEDPVCKTLEDGQPLPTA